MALKVKKLQIFMAIGITLKCEGTSEGIDGYRNAPSHISKSQFGFYWNETSLYETISVSKFAKRVKKFRFQAAPIREVDV